VAGPAAADRPRAGSRPARLPAALQTTLTDDDDRQLTPASKTVLAIRRASNNRWSKNYDNRLHRMDGADFACGTMSQSTSTNIVHCSRLQQLCHYTVIDD